MNSRQWTIGSGQSAVNRIRCLLPAFCFYGGILCLSAFWSALAWAQGETATSPSGGFLTDTPAEVPSAVSTGKFFQMFIALVIVLALVVGLAYLLRRVSSRLQRTGGGTVKVIAQLPLGTTQFIAIVDIAGEVLVLGVTQQSVTALTEIDDPAILEKLRAERRAAGALNNLPPFRQWLNRAQQGDLD